jgi:hypothetical protein
MFVEYKTRLSDVSISQTETLWFNHQISSKQFHKRQELSLLGCVGKITVWHFGVSVLRCDTDDPATSSCFDWGRFDEYGRLYYRTVSAPTIIELFQFNRNPDTLLKMSFRRHHNTQVITHVETVPLGFQVYRDEVRRS